MWTWAKLFGMGSSGELPPRYADDGPIVLKTPKSVWSPGFAGPTRDSRFKTRLLEAERERDALARRLSALERMLADPERGENALLYFRLRAIWDACHRDLVVMADRFLSRFGTRSPLAETLPLAKRRWINTMLIAAAQEYYLAYREEQVADMARLAMRKTVERANFGLVEDCLRWQALAQELTARRSSDESLQGRVSDRARYLYARLRFDDRSSLPRVASLNALPSRTPPEGANLDEFAEVVEVNVLALDYWNLGEVLLS